AELTKPAGGGSIAELNDIREGAEAMGMLEGRVAICTGAARGVGAEVAKAMAREGAKIVIVDPGVGGAGEGGDQRPAQAMADEIKAEGYEAVANFGSVTACDDRPKMV